MAYQPAETFATTITAGIASGDTFIPLSAGATAALASYIGAAPSPDYTELSINDGVSYEIVRTVTISGLGVTVVRGIAGTPAAFPTGSTLRFVWTENGVQEVAAAVGAAVTLNTNIVGSVAGGPAIFNLFFPIYSVTSDLTLTGTYPNFTLGLAVPAPVAEGVTVVTGTTDFTIGTPTSEPSLALSSIFPTTSGGNVFGAGLLASGAITGIRVSNTGRIMEVAASSLPNGTYTTADITVVGGIITAIANGTVVVPPSAGTVTIVNAGTGITIGGVPSVNPTVTLANTGVTAGVYAGIQINAQGQIVAIPGGFSPISNITTSSVGIVIAAGGTGIKTIDIAAATDAVKGLVEFADDVQAANFATQNLALDPARLKTALNSIGETVHYIQSLGNALSGPVLTQSLGGLNPPAIGTVLVTADAIFSDPAAGADEFNQTWSMGIYENSVAVSVTPAFKSGMKHLSTILTGFSGGVIEVRCTTTTGTQVASGNLTAIGISNIV